uniref:NodB homology domain-containing protein n=1 Tax=Strigamia maritima TaxID=126957 RepID=T1JA58_STRMM
MSSKHVQLSGDCCLFNFAVRQPTNIDAYKCDWSNCQLPNCFCGTNAFLPGNIKVSEVPQMILLTFDDSVNEVNYEFYNNLLKNRKNPNNCPVTATFFVSHEWSDYSTIQNLYSQGHEMASHSISHGDGAKYSRKKWEEEILGQKEILKTLGGVQDDDIQGMRAPFLQPGGDNQFIMLQLSNFTYDSSLPVRRTDPPIWPYTLDYGIPHECNIPPCPKGHYPGLWEVPLVMWSDLNGGRCSMADACTTPTKSDDIYRMLMSNFEHHYHSNRSPFPMYYHYAWFTKNHNLEAFKAFIDTVLQLGDVYMVSVSQMIEWMKQPTPLSHIQQFAPWKCENQSRTACIKPQTCSYTLANGKKQIANTCQPSKPCNRKLCKLPNCFCYGRTVPGNISREQVPQMILLTFDDSVNDINWEFYQKLFNGKRKNPNGCPISATFYVSHEWTDYSKVQTLHSRGHEIASHSISHASGANFTVDRWWREIEGQRQIINELGLVPLEDIRGMRAPFLQPGGENQFAMLQASNFSYDATLTTSDPSVWPYTLDYAIRNRCQLEPCPELSYPGLWEIPLAIFTGSNGRGCSMADSCAYPITTDGVKKTFMKNFEKHYNGNRAPLGLYFHFAWFSTPHYQAGFLDFVNTVLALNDVYFVATWQAIEWMKHPTPLSEIASLPAWSCRQLRAHANGVCNKPKVCSFKFLRQDRFIHTCAKCPNHFPWLYNIH